MKNRKVCKSCGVDKTLRNFYREKECADGYKGKCKLCHRRDVNENRELKFEQYREMRRRYMADPANRANHNATTERWRQTERGKESVNRACRVWRRLNPDYMRTYNESRKQIRAEARA